MGANITKNREKFLRCNNDRPLMIVSLSSNNTKFITTLNANCIQLSEFEPRIKTNFSSNIINSV